MNNEIRIAINGALGDHLCATVMLRNIRKNNPYAKIIVGALYPKLLYNNPNIDEICPLLPEFIKYDRNPYKFGFEQSYGGKLSEAWCKIWNTTFDKDKLDYYVTKLEDDKAKSYTAQFKKPIILIAPHGGGGLRNGQHVQITQNKDWYINRWETLCRALRSKYTIIQIGSKTELPLVNVDERLLGGPIRDIIAIIPYCKLWISVDSFLQHAGNAVGKQGIVLFGKTRPSMFGHNSNVNIYKKVCPLEKCHFNNDIKSQWNIDIKQCDNRKCMEAIDVKEILNIIKYWNNKKFINGYKLKIQKLTKKASWSVIKRGRVEIEIPTCDRHGYLSALLANIRYQTYKNWDITIIDDGIDESIIHNEQIINTLKSFEADGHRWRLLRGTRQGPPIAHQKVLDNTEHEFVLIIGDDCLIPPNYLEKLYSNISKNKKIGAVGGICLHLSELNKYYPEEYIKETLEKIKNNPFDFIPLQWMKHPDNQLKSVNHLYGGFIYRTSALRKIGGFPKYLTTVGHREETDTTIRLWLAGYSLHIDPTIEFFHFRAKSGGIRNWNKPELYMQDDKKFYEKLEEYKKQHNYRGK